MIIMNSAFLQLQELFSTLENPIRAKVLLATHIAGKTDMNSANDIGIIYKVVFGEDLSAGSITSNLNRLHKMNLILKEKEKINGTISTNFHSMTDLGKIALLYIYLTTIGAFTIQEEDKLFKMIQNQNIRKVINFLLKNSFDKSKSIQKFISRAIQTKKEKIPQIKVEPITLDPPRIFAGKNPLRFRIFEELIWNHLDTGFGLSSDKLTVRLDVPGRIIAHLKALTPLVEETIIQKQKIYRLSRKGISVLVPFSWLLASTLGDIQAETGIFLAAPHPHDTPVSTLVRNSLNFFSSMKEIMGEL